MRIEIKATSELTTWEREHIHNWLIEEFDPEADGFEWSNVDWHVMVWIDDELVSHAEIVERIGRVGEQQVKLGGVGGVVTLATWRGRGLGRMAMERAWAFMCNDLAVEFGLLICDEKMVPFYQKLGWKMVEDPLVFDQPQGKVRSPDITMVRSCRGDKWLRGIIDLCGPPW